MQSSPDRLKERTIACVAHKLVTCWPAHVFCHQEVMQLGFCQRGADRPSVVECEEEPGAPERTLAASPLDDRTQCWPAHCQLLSHTCDRQSVYPQRHLAEPTRVSHAASVETRAEQRHLMWEETAPEFTLSLFDKSGEEKFDSFKNNNVERLESQR